MTRALWLPDVLRQHGLDVVIIDGWEQRGTELGTVGAIVTHHTAGPVSGIWPSGPTLIGGRGGPSPVPGPLCNVSVGRDLKVRVVAAGKSNNAGLGSWRGVTGNSHTLGNEVEHCGYLDREPVSQARWEVICRTQAALAVGAGLPVDAVCQHAEWAPTRKIDFLSANYPGSQLRADVAGFMHGVPPVPVTPPTPDSDWFDMATKDDLDGVVKERTDPLALYCIDLTARMERLEAALAAYDRQSDDRAAALWARLDAAGITKPK
jgi:hypothetical protein